MRRTGCLLALMGSLTLLAPVGARAADLYKIQPIFRLGEKVGDFTIRGDEGDFEIGTLNDDGQLVFVTENAAGGEMLLQYADGKLNPIVAKGMEGPVGKWPEDVGILFPVSMNEHGDLAFAIQSHNQGSGQYLGTFRWDPK